MARLKRCPWCWYIFQEMPETCPSCHKKITASPDGILTVEGMKPCPHCGKPNKPDETSCRYCSKVTDGSDARLDRTEWGKKAGALTTKIYCVLAILIIPSIFVSFGLFLAVSCLGVILASHMKTLHSSKSLKEASDSIFMLSLVFIVFGGALTGGLGWTVWEALKSKTDPSSGNQLLIMSGSIFLSGVASALWATRQ